MPWTKILRRVCFLKTGLSENVKNISVCGLFNKNIDFCTESAEKPTIYELLFLIAMTMSTGWNEKLAQKQVLYHKQSFPGLNPFLRASLKYWLTVEFLQVLFCSQTVAFKKAPAYKRQECADPRYEYG